MKQVAKQITTNDGKRYFVWNDDSVPFSVFKRVDDMSREVIWGLLFVVDLKRYLARRRSPRRFR